MAERYHTPALGIDPRAGCAASSLRAGGLDGPAEVYDADIAGRLDCDAVHEPDGRGADGAGGYAAGLAPENVALAVEVEVAGEGDRPVGGYHSEIVGLLDCRAIHLALNEPDLQLAVVPAPEDVVEAVAVEVSGSDHRPVGGLSADSLGRHERHAVHEPDRHGACRGVAPQNVAVAGDAGIAVEVTDPDDRPGQGHTLEAVGSDKLRRAVHEPHPNIAAGAIGAVGGATPESVAEAVAIEIAGSDHRPVGGDIAERLNLDDGRAGARAVQKPSLQIAIGFAPQQVGFAIAVEVALPDDRPSVVPSGGGERDGQCEHRTVHHPHRHSATGVAPQDVALAVAVEIVGRGRRIGLDRRRVDKIHVMYHQIGAPSFTRQARRHRLGHSQIGRTLCDIELVG